MNLFDAFRTGHGYADFLARYGTPAYLARWQTTFDTTQLTPAQTDLLRSFKRQTNVLVMAGAWCGDCANQCPIFERFAQAAPVVQLRFVDNRENPAVQAALKVNGGDRVPVVVFFSEDGFEVGRYGDRTLAKYRQMVKEQVGESCSTGLTVPGDPLFAQVVQDWLDEFERVQWILRLSPRLRKLHND